PNSLACDQVREIFEDRNNNLFIGTNCGLCLYDPDHDNFINFMSLESSPLNGIDCNTYSITADSLDNLWLSTNVGLIYFDRRNNTSKIYTNDPNDPESLINTWVEYTYLDSKGRIWVSTRGGLDLFLPESETFKHITKGVDPYDDYSGITFLEIAEDQHGNIWFGSYNGLFCIENSSEDNETLIFYSNDPGDPNSISDQRLLSVIIDKENNLWVGAENDGLYLFNREQKNFWHYQTDDYDLASLSNNSIQAITMDNSGNLWIGTYGGGLNISPKNSEGIIQFKNLKGGDQSLSHNVVSSMHEDYKSRIWIGTDGGGLNLFNESTKRFKRFNKSNSGLSSNVILSIAEDKNHNLWMGSWDGGLIKFNPDTKNYKTFTIHNSKIFDNNIFCVELGDNNDLWLASYRNGLIHFNIETEEFRSYNQNNSNIGNDYVFIVKNDNKGNLILGTTNGIKIFSPENETFTNYPQIQNNQNSISHGTVYDILIENDTCMWIGTQSGLNRFNPETGTFTRFYEKDGLPSNVVRGLVFDKNGILWVTTAAGICKFDIKKKIDLENTEFDIFTKEDGLQSNEFNYKSTMLSKQGNLFIGGMNGFNIISPEKILKNSNVPEITFTGLEIFNKPIAPNSPNSPLTTSFSETKEITLNYDQSVLTFYFAIMDFTRPEKNEYAYMLENFDNDWIFSGNKNEATYTNLDPGKYIMRIKGTNNDGVWNDEGTSLKIVILPPWWKTLWFRLILLFIISGLVVAIFYIRTSSLRNQKERLSKEVKERTHDLNEKNSLLIKQSKEMVKTNTILINNQETIKTQSEELKVTAENLEETNKELASINATKDKLFSIIAHDLKNPFNVILGYTDLLITNFNDWDSTQSLEILSYVKESSANAYNLLENLLNWSRSQRGAIEFDPSPTNAAEIINMVFAEVISFARKKEVEIVNLF
ncbi:MAG: hypothetical protein HQ541_20330, partial [Mariniphaga sp.]|nr:hypothetical protein [Mariniphaga sp.]